MEILEKLRKIADKAPSKITTAEKELLVSLAADNGVHINPLCPDCYKDAAITLYQKLKPADEQPTAGGYKLKPGVDVIFCARNGNHYHICDATLTSKAAREWIAAGAANLFAETPNGSNE